MADALLSICLGKLDNVLGQQLSMFAGATDELQKLKDTFQAIQALLADAESRQVADESVRLWLSRLRHVAYDIDDLLEDWLISGLQNDGSHRHRNEVSTCLSSPYACLDHTVSRYKVARRIKEIMGRLDQIADDKNKYCFSVSGSSSRGNRMDERSRPQTSSLMEEGEMLGRENDKEIVISRLVSGSNHEYDGQVLHVIAIVGIGGLGKTTLAREIYHDGRVQHHFYKFLWVCVSDVFDVIRLTKAILEEVKGTSTSLSGINSLQNELLESLRGKRFLLVLDDVWNDDAEKWQMLRLSLKSGARGSKILVTTRSEKVANTMNAAYIHELKGLSDDHSWTLFSSRAFAGSKAEEYWQLESVGRQIVSKCKGVPLSIKVMGSAMNSKKTMADWQNVLDSNTWSLPQVMEKIVPALLLSYYNLPAHLKQCFAYCSIYQKDAVMVKDKLVKLWVAQGFIQSQGNREIEDIGAEYFDDLVAWSMFQEVSEEENKTTCKMHDLLHDLAEFITTDESYIFMSGRSNQSSANIRHASLFLSENNPSISIASCRSKKLRTLFLYGGDKIDQTLVDLFCRARFLRALLFRSEIETLPKTVGKLKHLRYLDMSNSWIVELPNAIGKMKHLKYLDLSNSGLMEMSNAIGKMKQLTHLDLSGCNIAVLPESVSNLLNLQTLNLAQCDRLKKLPRDMGKMVGLRHLEIKKTDSLEFLPKGLGRINSLRSLCKFIVGGEGGCGIDELQRLNSLQGCLEIQHLERVSSREEALRAELWKKTHLRKLVLQMLKRDEEITTSETDAETERMDSVLEGLRPHENLKMLKLVCYGCSKLPSWMEEGLCSPNLTDLEIYGFLHCEHLRGLGNLTALKCLIIEEVGVRKVGHELHCGNDGSRDVISAFPKMEHLILRNMREFEKWELSSKVMPSLRKLELYSCPKLEALSHHLAKSPLEELIIEGCERIEGTGCSFPLLEKFTLSKSSEFFSNGLPDLPSLKEFRIRQITKETLPDGGWERLVAIQGLYIRDCDELKSLPDGLGQLQSLEKLYISDCNKLQSLPDGLGQLKKLKSLAIESMEALTDLPDSLGQLTSLENLDVVYCEKLKSLPHSLGHLKSLRIDHLEALTCLPDALGQLESLEDLAIGGWKELQSLPHWLGQLKALKYLRISHCTALGSLPHGMQNLSLLRELWIDGCPILSERCKREGGEDWPKISHIPTIIVDGQCI